MMEGMGYNLDPNMLVSALAKDNDDSFIGGSNGLLWIFLLLLFGGGNGFGFGNKDSAIEGQVEAALAKAQAAGYSTDTILTAIAGNKEQVSQLGSYLGVEVRQVQNAVSALSSGLCELGYKMGQDTASIISNITSGNAAISRQLAECCCNTQRAIDGVNYNMATQFAATNNNVDKQFCALGHLVENKIDTAQAENRANFTAIERMFTTDKIDALQKELAATQYAASQQAQTQVLKDYVASYFGCPPGVITCGKKE